MMKVWLFIGLFIFSVEANLNDSPIHDDEGAQETVFQVDDMIFTPEEFRERFVNTGRSKRQWEYRNTRHWTGQGNVVPYRFAPGFTESWKPLVAKAAEEWQATTCLTFRPARPSDQHVIEFYHGSGCTSPVGMHRVNRISLKNPGCNSHRTILHEIGHSIGMGHEQQHPNAERYLTVHYDRIEESWRRWYRPMPVSSTTTHGYTWDPYSVMHYSPGNPRSPMMSTKDKQYQNIIGRQRNLSPKDSAFIRLTHKCGGGGGGGGVTTRRPATPRPTQPPSGTCRGPSGQRSGNGQSVQQTFVNNTPGYVRLMWVDYNGSSKTGWTIAPGQSKMLRTNTMHPYVALSESGRWLKIGGACVFSPRGGTATITL